MDDLILEIYFQLSVQQMELTVSKETARLTANFNFCPSIIQTSSFVRVRHFSYIRLSAKSVALTWTNWMPRYAVINSVYSCV